MKYIIVEDEPYALERLKALVKRIRPNWQLEFESDSVEDTLNYFREGHRPDICFFDIELSDGNVFDVIKKYASEIPVIFTTAYNNYCLDAFRSNSVGYVMKPIEEDELENAIVKFEKMWQNIHRQPTTDKPTKAPERVLISTGDVYGYINISQIWWFLSEDKCVFAITADGKSHLTAFRTLNEVEDIVDPDKFFRITRHIICSIQSISKINRYFKGRLNVQLVAGSLVENFSVSSAKRAGFLAWIGAGS